MKTKLISALLFSAFLSVSAIAQSADEIINHHIDAIGGTSNWSKLNTLKLTGNVDIGPNMKAPFTITMKDKTKMRFELVIQGMTMVQAVDGDSGWSIVPFSGKNDPERMSPEDLKSAQEQADYTGELYNYKSKGSTVEFLGKEDMEGTDTYKLKVTKKNGDVTYFYLDATSYLELKETSKHKFKDKEVESATLSSNYKDVSGMKFPFSLEMRGSDQESSGQTMTIDAVEVNPVVDDQIFKMPAMASAVKPETGGK